MTFFRRMISEIESAITAIRITGTSIRRIVDRIDLHPVHKIFDILFHVEPSDDPSAGDADNDAGDRINESDLPAVAADQYFMSIVPLFTLIQHVCRSTFC